MALSQMKTSTAFWTTGPGEGGLADAPLAVGVGPGEPWVEVETLYSGISRGTETLVFQGLVPESEYQRMRAPFQEGDFPFPLCHGYSNIGRVVDAAPPLGPSLKGALVFSLFRHQRRFRVPASSVTVLPDNVPPQRAVLAANMETAVNGLWDGRPMVGDRIAVIGCGVVGCLVAWLAAQIPGARVTAVDINLARQPVTEALGADFVAGPLSDDHDLVFHTSGQPEGLVTALGAAGQEGRIVDLSWYGNRPVRLPLGQAFHARRLQIISSQVGQLPPERRPRWDHGGRLALALSLLADPVLDRLISGESAFEELPKVMKMLVSDADALCHRIAY